MATLRNGMFTAAALFGFSSLLGAGWPVLVVAAMLAVAGCGCVLVDAMDRLEAAEDE